MQLHLETSHPNCAEHARTALNSADLVVTVTVGDEDDMQFAGIHETVLLYLENQSWVVAGGAAIGVVGSEIVKDLYKKVKSLAASLFKHFNPQGEQHGVELNFSPRGRHKEGFADTPDEIVQLTYSGRSNSRGPYYFDEKEVEYTFLAYETVVAPVISYWRQNASVTQIHARAYFGPGVSDPKWEVYICGSGGKVLVSTSVDIRR